MDEGRTHYVGDGCPGGHADVARAAGIVRTTGDTVTALDRLRTIAEQACAGPWEALGGYPQHVVGYSPDPPSEDTRRVEVCTVHNAPESGAPDAEFIATFDPETVLALLDVAEAAAPLVNHVGKSQDGEWDAAEERLSDALDRLREVSS